MTEDDMRIAQLEGNLKRQEEMREQDAKLEMTGSLDNPKEAHKQLLAEHDRLIALYKELISRMKARIASTPR